MVSRLVRQELLDQNRPGVIGRLVNNPVVLVLLFVLCVGTLVWTFWPSSPDAMYRKGVALMESDRPGDWDRAWEEYLDPLQKKFPDHPYEKELAELRQEYDDKVAEHAAKRAARSKKAISEGQWFFEKGMRLRRNGREKEAQQVWRTLVAAYAHVPSQKPWVRRAEEELAKKEVRMDDPPEPEALRDALERASKLGQQEELKKIRQALQDLYANDPAGPVKPGK
jgi:hypothetical protein